MAVKHVTKKVRASYLNVFTPRENNFNGKNEYSMQILIDKKDKEQIEAIKKSIRSALKERFTNEEPKKWRTPLRDGDEENENGNIPAPGYWYLSAKTSESYPPGIIDRDKNEIIDPRDFVSGDYCRVSVNFAAYDTAGKRGVGCYLNNIQFLEKGEPLGNQSRPQDDFDDLDDDNDDW